MPKCTITGLHWNNPECPHDVQWPHPALAMGTILPVDKVNFRSLVLMLGGCLSELVRCDRAELRAPISKDGKRFPSYCSLEWLSLHIVQLRKTTDFICDLTPTMARLYPSIVIDHNLRLDTWMQEVAMVRDGLKHESIEFMQARQAHRERIANDYAHQELALIAAMTGTKLAKNGTLVRAAYIESIIANASLNEPEALERIISNNPNALQRARAILLNPTNKHSASALREAMLFAELFAPHDTIGKYEQYRAVMAALDDAVRRLDAPIELLMPALYKSETKLASDNIVLTELQKRLQALAGG